MSTPPLSAGLIAQLSARTQAVRWTVTLKEVRQFRAYCCNIDSDGIMGVAKEPVIIADIGPNPVCEGSAISWDLTDSYAPGSTISAWEIDFGDGNSDTGASIGSASGSHTYADAGTYTITIEVEEGTGRTQTATAEITVVECSEPPLDWTYLSTYGEGVFFIDWTADAPEWVERNTSLSGDALYVNSMVLRPGDWRKATTQHELWIATNGGVFRSQDGGRSWDEMILPDPSNTEFEDSPPATVGELSFKCVRYDPTDSSVVYVEAHKEIV